MYALDLIRTRRAPLAWGWHICPGFAWLQGFIYRFSTPQKKKVFKEATPGIRQAGAADRPRTVFFALE
jgi:hypothetical protein